MPFIIVSALNKHSLFLKQTDKELRRDKVVWAVWDMHPGSFDRYWRSAIEGKIQRKNASALIHSRCPVHPFYVSMTGLVVFQHSLIGDDEPIRSSVNNVFGAVCVCNEHSWSVGQVACIFFLVILERARRIA